MLPGSQRPVALSHHQIACAAQESSIDPADRAVLNVWKVFAVRGNVEKSTFTSALRSLVARFELLRSVFKRQGSSGSQFTRVVLHETDVRVEINYVFNASEADVQRLQNVCTTATFDISSAPLFRLLVSSTTGSRETHILIVAHSMIMDLFSLNIFMQFLAALYGEGVQAPTARKLAVVHQFEQYVSQWEQRAEGVAAITAAEEFWRKELSGLPPRISLSFSSSSKAAEERTATQAIQRFAVRAEMVETMLEFAHLNDCSLHTLLLAAYMLFLYRYSGDADLVVSVPSNLRDLTQATRDMLGPLAGLLLLRCTITSRTPTFVALLKQVNSTYQADREQALLSGEALRATMGVAKTDITEHLPLSQVLFEMHKLQPEGVQGVLVPEEIVDPVLPSPKLKSLLYDLEMHVYEKNSPSPAPKLSLEIALRYRTDVLWGAKAEQMGSQFLTLLQALLTEPPTKSLNELKLLSDPEANRLLYTPNDTVKRTKHQHESIPALFERQVKKRGSAHAVEFEGQRVTYTQLQSRAAQQLTQIQETLGTGRKSSSFEDQMLILVCAHRCTDLIAALLAVLQLGAAYVPVDPSTPPERARVVLEDSGAVLVVTDSALRNSHFSSSWYTGPLVLIDAAPEQGGDRRSAIFTKSPRSAMQNWEDALHARGRKCRPNFLHNVIYTSGSTGKPKGVAVFECSAVNLLSDYVARLEIATEDLVLAATSISFDVSSGDLFAPLMVGACILVVPDGAARDGFLTAPLLDRCTVAFFTPSGWRIVLAVGWEGNKHLQAVTAGEALPTDVAVPLVARVGKLWDLWGPTETTIYSSGCQVLDPLNRSIGRPLNNQRLYILNAANQLQPVGVVGEICVGGAGVAQGYLKLPQLSATKFVPDPFAQLFELKVQPENEHERRHLLGDGRMFRTGDLGYWDENLNVRYIGRADTQVKIRGYRVELGEIEQQLLAVPGGEKLQQVLVRPYEVTAGSGHVLVAYLKLKPHTQQSDAPNARLQRSHSVTHTQSSLSVPKDSLLADSVVRVPASGPVTNTVRNNSLRPAKEKAALSLDLGQVNGSSLRGSVVYSRSPRSPRGDAKARAVIEASLIDQLRRELTARLPPYMVPSFFVVIENFPLNRAGKIDQAALPKPDPSEKAKQERMVPTGPIEQELVMLFSQVLNLNPSEIGADSNIFSELGATSLTSVRIVEAFNLEFDPPITVAQLFKLGTIRALANKVSGKAKSESISAHSSVNGSRPTSRAILLGSQVNTAGNGTDHDTQPVRSSWLWDIWWAFWCLLGIAALGGLTLIVHWPALRFLVWMLDRYSLLITLAAIPAAYLGWGLVWTVLIILLKWLVIGRYSTGRHRVRSFYFFRWWFVDRLIAFGVPLFIGRFVGTPVWNLFLLAMGTKVDLLSSIHTLDIRGYDLVEIGSRSTINRNACIRPEEFTSDSRTTCPNIRMGRIKIARNAWIGHRAVVPMQETHRDPPVSYVAHLGTVDEPDRSALEHFQPKTPYRYGALEVLLWIPFSFIGVGLMAAIRVAHYYPVFLLSKYLIGLMTDTNAITSDPHTWVVLLAYSLSLQPFFLNPFITLLAEQQVLSSLGAVAKSSMTVLVFLPITSFVNVLAGVASLVLAKWVLVWRVCPQSYARGSFTHFRHWLWQMILISNYECLSWWSDTAAQASIWCLMGASIRPENWMNGGALLQPDLVSLGRRAAVGWTGFLHPDTTFGDWIVLDRVQIPDGGMVGMHGALMGGSKLPAGAILGVLTPLLPGQQVEEHTRLVLGGANVPLSDPSAPDWWRVRFSCWRWTKLVLFEFIYSVFAPLFVLLVRAAAIAPTGWLLLEARQQWGRKALAFLPAGFVTVLFTGCIFLILVKWIWQGRFRPQLLKDPEATTTYWRHLLVRMTLTMVLKQLGGVLLVGSPWWNWLLKLMGVHVSTTALLLTHQIIDFDIVYIGDGSVLEPGMVITPHNREANEFAFANLKIGKGCVAGHHSVAMYNVEMEDDSVLAPLSFVMPGQRLQQGKTYSGVPSVVSRRGRSAPPPVPGRRLSGGILPTSPVVLQQV